MKESLSDLERILTLLQSDEGREKICEFQTRLTRAQAVPPEHGGDGELKKANYVEEILKACHVDTISHLDSKDARVSSGIRPNIIAKRKGHHDQTLWLFGHLDVVGAGDRSAWDHDPFDVFRDGDWLYGRGVEDNQQAITSMLLLAWALDKTGITPDRTLGLVFMADEENGSTHGLAHILSQNPGLFRHDDFYLVPDFGSPLATDIEVAEKCMFWLRIETIGKQCHASTPEQGKNAFVMGSHIVTELAKTLPRLYPEKNPLFSPQTATFVPSRHDLNVEGINLVPGRDIFHLDARLLPEHDSKEVLQKIHEIVEGLAAKEGFETKISIVQDQPSSLAPKDHPSVEELKKAIRNVYDVEPRIIGVGGGTVAALLRKKGLPALVWACLENTCHQPNERSSITATSKDSSVFANLLMNHA